MIAPSLPPLTHTQRAKYYWGPKVLEIAWGPTLTHELL